MKNGLALMFKTADRSLPILCIVLLACGAAFYRVAHLPPPALFQPAIVSAQSGITAPDTSNAEAGIDSHFASTRQDIHTHAASLVELGDGRVRAFWFAGSREGAKDVEIRSAIFDPEKNRWSAEQGIVNRADTQRSLLRYVKKLGNPVAQRAPDGTLWLFYVTVSLGGWAGSSITTMTSIDDGATWSPARRLISSPFMNISTLVKGTPFLYDDGTIGLPVYHEFIGKFGELLRISKSGEVIDKQRMSSGKSTLQPVVLIQNPQQALVLMRYSGASPKRVVATSTGDAGQHWSLPAKTALANPDAAISGVRLPDGRILMALNNTEAGRDALSLVVSADGGAIWKTVYQLEDQHGLFSEPARFMQTAGDLAKATEADMTDATGHGKSAQRNKCKAQLCGFEFSYPYLIQTQSGDFHLVYTWNRSFIKHVRFTPAWLDQQIGKLPKEKFTDGRPH